MSIKNFLGNPTYSIIFLLTIFMFFSFKGCTKDSKNPIIEDEEDNQTTVFFKESEPEDVIAIETSTGGKLNVIGNNVLISVDPENIDPDGIKAIIEETGGELVGQFPAIGMYQAEYPFSTETELMSMIDTLNNYSEVEFATYNALINFPNAQHSKDYCNRDYDNHKLDGDKNRFFEDMEYYLAVPLMGLVREHMTLSKVKVLVIDSMVETQRTKEFDGVTPLPTYTNPITIDLSKHKFVHGTMVAGTIAADNKDGGVNGIASSLIIDKLELISAACDTNNRTVTGLTNLLHRVMDGGDPPKICNMSWGWGVDKNGNVVNVECENKFFKDIFKHYSDVLFVVSASNKYYKITNTNAAPAGIQLPNVITVACTRYNSPQIAASWSAYGPLIDIAAPAEYAPVVDPAKANAVKIVSGNSIGAPAVAALAAVLKSISPSLPPVLIKDLILENSSSTAPSISGRRLVLPQPIEQLLIDMGAPDEILEKIDMPPDGEWDLPGIVAARICNISTIEIAGEPIMVCETSDTSNTGSVIENTGGMIVFSTESQGVLVRFHNTHEILNLALEIVEYEGEGLTNGVTVSYLNLNTLTAGNSISGSITIKNGIITERYPGTNYPMVIEAEATMSGIMEMVLSPGIGLTESNFSGLMIITILMPWIGSEEFYNYFEDNCD